MIGSIISGRAAEMGIALPEGAEGMFDRFHAELISANSRFNLTRVPDDAAEAADRNYIDSIAPIALGLFSGVRRVADLGSGAGFPGVPLAVALPDAQFTLIDSLKKRVSFIEEAARAAAILNVCAIHARAEDIGRDTGFRDSFDLVTARAVAPLVLLAELALPLVRPGGALIAYKGPSANDEVTGAEALISEMSGRLRGIYAVDIPGRDWRHNVVVIDKLGETPPAYPRRSGRAGGGRR